MGALGVRSPSNTRPSIGNKQEGVRRSARIQKRHLQEEQRRQEGQECADAKSTATAEDGVLRKTGENQNESAKK